MSNVVHAPGRRVTDAQSRPGRDESAPAPLRDNDVSRLVLNTHSPEVKGRFQSLPIGIDLYVSYKGHNIEPILPTQQDNNEPQQQMGITSDLIKLFSYIPSQSISAAAYPSSNVLLLFLYIFSL